MVIETLPQTTVRALGAAQVLNDPAAVVKELIDNALDARATSIAIEISSNTLDSIQLRDNGHGIPREDQPLLARRHCTSKIRSEDELNSVAGRSLGFRGEALSSFAEMSTALTVTTRVEGEQVATVLKIDRRGEVVDQSRASLPVGTTVKASGFLQMHPVRRQVALKNSDRCLANIKHCLQAYAFARPHVRLSLRVLKANDHKSNWMYAPTPGGNAEDVAFKIVGSACASQCSWSVVEYQGFTLKAFLPKPQADASKIGNFGAFLSVDARPVSVVRAAPKQIIQIFRQALKKGGGALCDVKEPFFHLEISCPIGSYDANIEPAKDDVLFENPEMVLESARRLFAMFYPPSDAGIMPHDHVDYNALEHCASKLLPEEDGVLTSLESPTSDGQPSKSNRTRLNLVSHSLIKDLINNNDSAKEQISASNTRPSFRHNMYGCDAEDLDVFDAPTPNAELEGDFEELRQASKDVTLSNPWIMARMNASLRQQGQQHPAESERERYFNKHISPVLPSSDIVPSDVGAQGLPTPRPSSPLLRECFQSSVDEPHSSPRASKGVFQPIFLRTEPGRSREIDDSLVASPAVFSPSSQASQSATGTPLHAIPDISSKRSQGHKKALAKTRINKPFKAPVARERSREKVWFDHLERQPNGRANRKKKPLNANSSGHGLVARGELGDLVDDPRPLTPPKRNRDMRDFLSRRDVNGDEAFESAIDEQASIGQTTTRPIVIDEENTGPIHHGDWDAFPSNCESAARKFTVEDSTEPAAPQPSKRGRSSGGRILSDINGNGEVDDVAHGSSRATEDRRAPSRRRRTSARTKLRRRRTSHLPLERVPSGRGTQNARLRTSTTRRKISHLVRQLNGAKSVPSFHDPVSRAGERPSSAFQSVVTEDITQRLHQVLHARVSDGEVAQDLKVLVESAIEGHCQSMLGAISGA